MARQQGTCEQNRRAAESGEYHVVTGVFMNRSVGKVDTIVVAVSVADALGAFVGFVVSVVRLGGRGCACRFVLISVTQ